MIIINYRKANISDLDEIVKLVTNLLGTCNIEKQSRGTKINSFILNSNKSEIKKTINNYYVCESDKKIIGACGISDIKKTNIYNIELGEYREILYLVIDNNYQRKGIGTKLVQLCCEGVNDKVIYEAWGDKEYVNSKFLLLKCGFKLLKDLGDTYYKDNNYCSYCINRNKNCNSCKAELWMKDRISDSNY